MKDSTGSSKKFYGSLGIVVFLILAALVAWNAMPVEHQSIAKQSKTLTLNCEFDRFRQIMVRKNATAAIVAHSGMKLLNEEVQGLTLDTSEDDRPLLNAIRGKSKSDLSAVKLLTVQLDDPTLEATELQLEQIANIESEELNVQTQSTSAAGRLENYATTLSAHPNAQSTEVTLTVDMTVRVRIPRFFVGRSDQRVQQEAEKAISEQAAALEDFIAEHAQQPLVLPEFGKQ